MTYEELKALWNSDKTIKEKNKKLIERYPFLKPHNILTGKDIEGYDYSWTLLDNMEEGWKKNFGLQMCEELLQCLNQCDYANRYYITQIKEKYGELCWYDTGVPGVIFDEFCDIIEKYQDLSRTICCVCGAPAEYVTTNWIGYYCDEHSKNDRNRVTIKRYEEMLNELYGK